MTPDTKACPYCGEMIKALAIKCRFCGEFLDGRTQQQALGSTVEQDRIDAKIDNNVEDTAVGKDIRQVHAGDIHAPVIQGRDIILGDSKTDKQYEIVLHWEKHNKPSLREFDLAKRNLSELNLAQADLRGANLSRADLTGANLRNAILAGANLTGANLTGVNLSGITLTTTKIGKDIRSEIILPITNHGRAILVIAVTLCTLKLLFDFSLFFRLLLNVIDMFKIPIMITAMLIVLVVILLGIRMILKWVIFILKSARLRKTFLSGAKYDSQTKWPKGFIPPTTAIKLENKN